MAWEYMEIKFGVRFVYGQKIKERKRVLGYIRMAEKLFLGNLIVDSKGNTFIGNSGKMKKGLKLTWSFKSVCFQYIQKLGMEGWELVGNADNLCSRRF